MAEASNRSIVKDGISSKKIRIFIWFFIYITVPLLELSVDCTTYYHEWNAA